MRIFSFLLTLRLLSSSSTSRIHFLPHGHANGEAGPHQPPLGTSRAEYARHKQTAMRLCHALPPFPHPSVSYCSEACLLEKGVGVKVPK